MKYYALYEILISALSSCLYGAAMGIIYSLLGLSVSVIRSLLLLPKRAFTLDIRCPWRSCTALVEELKTEGKGIAGHVSDFIYVAAYGVGLLILQYVYCDGAFRIYTAAISLLAAYLSYKTLGNLSCAAFLKIYSPIYAAIIKLLTLLLYPIRLAAAFADSKILGPAVRRLNVKILAKREARIIKKKLAVVGKTALLPKPAAKSR